MSLRGPFEGAGHPVGQSEVVSRLGTALDVNRDGLADPGRPFVHLVYPTLLDLCRSRADYPYPCIGEEDASVTEHSFDAPIKVQVPVP
jgi:hypothetical protein